MTLGNIYKEALALLGLWLYSGNENIDIFKREQMVQRYLNNFIEFCSSITGTKYIISPLSLILHFNIFLQKTILE